MESFADLTVRDFVGRLSSGEPVPGGGSASAIAASLGAGLVAMVAALSEGRPKYAEHGGLHRDAGERGRELAAHLLGLADRDSAAYASFAAALKLPRETDRDRATRDSAIRAAARDAAEIPLVTVEACRDVVAAAETLAGRSNRNAASDLGVAALLAEAGAQGAAANVLVNLPSLGAGDPFVGHAMTRVDELLREIGRLAEVTRLTVLSGEARPPLEAATAVEPG